MTLLPWGPHGWTHLGGTGSFLSLPISGLLEIFDRTKTQCTGTEIIRAKTSINLNDNDTIGGTLAPALSPGYRAAFMFTLGTGLLC